MILPPKTAEAMLRRTALALERFDRVSELISIDEARGRVLEAVRPLAAEDVPPGRGAGAACSPRTWRARSTCRPSTAPRWTATRWSPGPRPSSRSWARAARAVRRAIRWSRARRSGSRPERAVPAGATAVVPVEANLPPATGGRVRVRASARGRQRPPRRRGRRGRTGGARRRHAARARRAGRGRVRRAGLAALLAAAAGGHPRDGRRAHRAGPAARPGRDLQLERLGPRRPGRAGRRALVTARETVPDQAAETRDGARRPCSTRPTW